MFTWKEREKKHLIQNWPAIYNRGILGKFYLLKSITFTRGLTCIASTSGAWCSKCITNTNMKNSTILSRLFKFRQPKIFSCFINQLEYKESSFQLLVNWLTPVRQLKYAVELSHTTFCKLNQDICSIIFCYYLLRVFPK